MENKADIEKIFIKDTQLHQMTVLMDNGVNRHLVFRNPGSSFYWFELITWQGTLCINGDCGTYVFSRIDDMFRFFRCGDLSINPHYWLEKCQAECRISGARKFSPSKLKDIVTDYFKENFEGDEIAAKKCWETIEWDILGCNNAHDAHVALQDFDCEGFTFQDSWEFDLEGYTDRFIWCLYAIVWGIQQYDAYKAKEISNETSNISHE